MNIDDVIKKIDVPEDGPIITSIFEKQKELMVRYDEIEKKNGFQVPTPPYHLDNHLVQFRIKDMFWRVTEELAEAVEVIPQIGNKLQDWPKYWREADVQHFFEEIADAMHFLVEASIIAGFPMKNAIRVFNLLPAKRIEKKVSLEGSGVVRGACASVIFQLGLTANLLKNKPWKCTQMGTDIPTFMRALEKSWQYFVILCGHLACSQKYMYILYMKKNIVNHWRQDTNY